MTHRLCVCQDGPRKGRQYHWPIGTREFGITSLVPGDVKAVYEGDRMSGYGQYIYKVYALWGSGVDGAFFDRLAYA